MSRDGDGHLTLKNTSGLAALRRDEKSLWFIIHDASGNQLIEGTVPDAYRTMSNALSNVLEARLGDDKAGASRPDAVIRREDTSVGRILIMASTGGGLTFGRLAEAVGEGFKMLVLPGLLLAAMAALLVIPLVVRMTLREPRQSLRKPRKSSLSGVESVCLLRMFLPSFHHWWTRSTAHWSALIKDTRVSSVFGTGGARIENPDRNPLRPTACPAGKRSEIWPHARCGPAWNFGGPASRPSATGRAVKQVSCGRYCLRCPAGDFGYGAARIRCWTRRGFR